MNLSVFWTRTVGPCNDANASITRVIAECVQAGLARKLTLGAAAAAIIVVIDQYAASGARYMTAAHVVTDLRTQRRT